MSTSMPIISSSVAVSSFERRRQSTPAAATCSQFTHWGELIQGPVEHRGRIVTGLITLPRFDLCSTATFTPHDGPLCIHPKWCTKANLAVQRVLQLTGNSDCGGTLVIRSNIPLGCGAGGTTADVTASIRAVSRAFGVDLPPDEVQAIDWEIERAADPLALIANGDVVLYGSRIGETIKRLRTPLPSMRCLAFNPAPGRQVLTEEVARNTHYTVSEVKDFRGILSRAIAAIQSGNIGELAVAATESARLNQTRVMIPDFNFNVDRCLAAGALGMSVSHSGTVAAAIFDPADSQVDARMNELAAKFVASGYSHVASFDV
ncbi:hypothetical protein [Novipirellula sp.]|uniref:GHMP family kinase ATP-binding protein n=1 Tax=Novipirellula sp. TaxID=2795430 RepID=UPI0035657C33